MINRFSNKKADEPETVIATTESAIEKRTTGCSHKKISDLVAAKPTLSSSLH